MVEQASQLEQSGIEQGSRTHPKWEKSKQSWKAWIRMDEDIAGAMEATGKPLKTKVRSICRRKRMGILAEGYGVGWRKQIA